MKEDIKIGDEVALANPHLADSHRRFVVKGLTAVEKLVYLEDVNSSQYYGHYHIDNLRRA